MGRVPRYAVASYDELEALIIPGNKVYYVWNNNSDPGQGGIVLTVIRFGALSYLNHKSGMIEEITHDYTRCDTNRAWVDYLYPPTNNFAIFTNYWHAYAYKVRLEQARAAQLASGKSANACSV